jgi:hypothetical protein
MQQPGLLSPMAKPMEEKRAIQGIVRKSQGRFIRKNVLPSSPESLPLPHVWAAFNITSNMN